MQNRLKYGYAFIIFLGAFLIFQIQPMISKFILPWFGGTPSVWTVCMLFFQVFLFGGYYYAHIITSRCTPRVQAVIHCILLVAAAVLVLVRTVLPRGLDPGTDAFPVFHILFALVVTIGLPYLILAATSPLLQFWFGRDGSGREPYILYSVSNIGSLMALVSYPVVIEPLLPLRIQSLVWSICFACFAAGCCIIAFVSGRRKAQDAGREAAPVTVKTVSGKSRVKQEQPGIGIFEHVAWMALPMLSTMLLVAVTNQLCTDVSSGPFLWILPLCIYLLTFILTFTGWRFVYNRLLFFLILAAGLVVVSFILQRPGRYPFLFQILAYSVVLYLGCTAVHGELYRLRPGQDMLTKYYLFVSAGGALGGIFVGIAAPLIFRDYFELHLVGVAVLIAMIVCWYRDKYSNGKTKKIVSKRAVMLAATGLVTVAVAGMFVYQIFFKMDKSREVRRSFFGVVQVQELSPGIPSIRRFRLIHGNTYHGIQFVDPSRRNSPTAYYSPKSGIGLVLTRFTSERPVRVGAIGLGVGTIAAYARENDIYRFFEINPDVISIANDERYFHYLKDARGRGAEIEIVPGDGRLSMEQEAKAAISSGADGAEKTYDVIVLDAFSSDSIPMHLLTREAFECYFSLLGENGVIAVHITNQKLDLFPVVAAVAELHGVRPILLVNEGDPNKAESLSSWVLLTNDAFYVDTYDKHIRPNHTILWTDEFSNLLSTVRWELNPQL